MSAPATETRPAIPRARSEFVGTTRKSSSSARNVARAVRQGVAPREAVRGQKASITPRRARRLGEYLALNEEIIAEHYGGLEALADMTMRERNSVLFLTHIPNAPVCEMVFDYLAKHPEESLFSISKRAGLDERYLRRMLGLLDTTIKKDTSKSPPRRCRVIPVEHASNVVRAIGRAPVEVPGL